MARGTIFQPQPQILNAFLQIMELFHEEFDTPIDSKFNFSKSEVSAISFSEECKRFTSRFTSGAVRAVAAACAGFSASSASAGTATWRPLRCCCGVFWLKRQSDRRGQALSWLGSTLMHFSSNGMALEQSPRSLEMYRSLLLLYYMYPIVSCYHCQGVYQGGSVARNYFWMFFQKSQFCFAFCCSVMICKRENLAVSVMSHYINIQIQWSTSKTSNKTKEKKKQIEGI